MQDLMLKQTEPPAQKLLQDVSHFNISRPFAFLESHNFPLCGVNLYYSFYASGRLCILYHLTF